MVNAMGASGGSAGMTAEAFQKFRVELDKLRAAAGALQQEVDALRGSADGMAGSPNFGDPGIVGVSRLGPKHQNIIAPTQQLISDIQGGIAAGEEALRTAASRYEEADNKGSATMQTVTGRTDDAVTGDLGDGGFEAEPDHRYGGLRPF